MALFIGAVISPSPSKLNILSSTSKHSSSALFFFLGAMVLLIVLLVLIFWIKKFIKTADLKLLISWKMRGPGTGVS